MRGKMARVPVEEEPLELMEEFFYRASVYIYLVYIDKIIQIVYVVCISSDKLGDNEHINRYFELYQRKLLVS